MTKEIWLNLPVKDIARSKAFFTALGFSFDPRHGNSTEAAGMIIGEKKMMVMLFNEANFRQFTGHEIADTAKGNELLISFDAESREEIDELARKAEAAGGTIFGKPTEHQGWMYGCGFIDPDGHRWNALFMDMDKLPKG
jgi:predicted lactoylglutathione lyase